MKRFSLIFISVFFLLLISCSSSEEAAKTEEKPEPEIYVFDDVSETIDSAYIDEQKTPMVDEVKTTQYFVQVGAFTTRDRADEFVKLKSPQTNYQLNITYSDEVKLYVVRLPAFSTRAEAEKVRNEFWQSGLFNDAFIVTQ